MAAGVIVMPTIVPSSVFGKNAPGNLINIGQIGCGRIARVHDMASILKYDQARYVAVCDLDKNRLSDGKKLIEDYEELLKLYLESKSQNPRLTFSLMAQYT